MREDRFRELLVEMRDRRQHLRAPHRMRSDLTTLAGRQFPLLVHNVEERLVDLSDVVKERPKFDGASHLFVDADGV